VEVRPAGGLFGGRIDREGHELASGAKAGDRGAVVRGVHRTLHPPDGAETPVGEPVGASSVVCESDDALGRSEPDPVRCGERLGDARKIGASGVAVSTVMARRTPVASGARRQISSSLPTKIRPVASRARAVAGPNCGRGRRRQRAPSNSRTPRGVGGVDEAGDGVLEDGFVRGAGGVVFGAPDVEKGVAGDEGLLG